MSDDEIGLPQRLLLVEVREDLKGLKATVEANATDRRWARVSGREETNLHERPN